MRKESQASATRDGKYMIVSNIFQSLNSSLVGLNGKHDNLVRCTTYGSLTKMRVVRWLIYSQNGNAWQAVLRTVRRHENVGGPMVV